MKQLAISNDLALPLDVVTQKLAFLGRTGSGKTYAATKLTELMLDAGAQVVVLDPVGVWHGLRLGDRPFAIPVFGGLHGDVPLEATGGALIADLIVDRGLSAVLDLSQMIPAELCRFATDFADKFFQRKKNSPSAVHMPIEECQEFVPQNPMKGEEKMLHNFERLIKLGRNFGIGVSLISQRPQEVNKKALNQTECMFAFQMTGPQERKAIEGWVSDKGLDVDVKAVLPRLKIGHAYAWSPQWLDFSGEVRISKKRTADASSTPKVGDAKRKVRELSPIDLDAVRIQMTETIERAKLEDPKALRAENAQLKKKVSELERAVERKTVEPKIVEVKVPVFRAGEIERLDAKLLRLESTSVQISKTVRELSETVAKAVTEEAKPGWSRVVEAKKLAGVLPKGPSVSELQRTLGSTVATGVSLSAPLNGSSEVGKGGLYRILVALAQRPQGLTQRQIGVRAGLSSKSGSFGTYLSKARTSGWVEGGRGDMLRITDEGLKALGSYEPLPTGQALLVHWLGELGGGAARLLQVVADAYPGGIQQADAAAKAGLSGNSGTFSTYCAKLRTLELVHGRGELRASEELFE